MKNNKRVRREWEAEFPDLNYKTYSSKYQEDAK